MKRKAICQRLVQLIGLSTQEADSLSIVAVSADPYEQGMEHWLANQQQHRQLSRIATLQNATKARSRQAAARKNWSLKPVPPS